MVECRHDVGYPSGISRVLLLQILLINFMLNFNSMKIGFISTIFISLHLPHAFLLISTFFTFYNFSFFDHSTILKREPQDRNFYFRNCSWIEHETEIYFVQFTKIAERVQELGRWSISSMRWERNYYKVELERYWWLLNFFATICNNQSVSLSSIMHNVHVLVMDERKKNQLEFLGCWKTIKRIFFKCRVYSVKWSDWKGKDRGKITVCKM